MQVYKSWVSTIEEDNPYPNPQLTPGTGLYRRRNSTFELEELLLLRYYLAMGSRIIELNELEWLSNSLEDVPIQTDTNLSQWSDIRCE